MVTKTEEEELKRLESQVEHGGGGAWDYLSLIRKLKIRRSSHVLKYGLILLNDPKKRSALADDEWTLFEQVAIAAMDCNSLDTARECIKVLSKKFPDSKRVGRLQAMLLEAKGCWEEAENAYSSLLEIDAVDQVIHKRRVAMAKAQGDTLKAIDSLNKYIEMYKQAAFCYEELLLAQPTVLLYNPACADVLYTLGGLENIQTAKTYYASTIELSGGKNTRALYGICLCTSAIGQLAKGRNKDEKDNGELHSLAAAALEKDYKYRATDKLPLLTSTLASLKISS